MVCFAPFFFFFEFQPDSTVSAVLPILANTADTARFEPHRCKSGNPRGRTRPDTALTCGQRRHSRVAASDTDAMALEPHPCIPARRYSIYLS